MDVDKILGLIRDEYIIDLAQKHGCDTYHYPHYEKQSNGSYKNKWDWWCIGLSYSKRYTFNQVQQELCNMINSGFTRADNFHKPMVILGFVNDYKDLVNALWEDKNEFKTILSIHKVPETYYVGRKLLDLVRKIKAGELPMPKKEPKFQQGEKVLKLNGECRPNYLYRYAIETTICDMEYDYEKEEWTYHIAYCPMYCAPLSYTDKDWNLTSRKELKEKGVNIFKDYGDNYERKDYFVYNKIKFQIDER